MVNAFKGNFQIISPEVSIAFHLGIHQNFLCLTEMFHKDFNSSYNFH